MVNADFLRKLVSENPEVNIKSRKQESQFLLISLENDSFF